MALQTLRRSCVWKSSPLSSLVVANTEFRSSCRLGALLLRSLHSTTKYDQSTGEFNACVQSQRSKYGIWNLANCKHPAVSMRQGSTGPDRETVRDLERFPFSAVHYPIPIPDILEPCDLIV